MTPVDVEQAALRLLTNREHSRQELARKLSARCHDPGVIKQVLDGLESHGYLSDERFTEQYLKSRINKGYGPLRIKSELQERGVQAEVLVRHLPDSDEWYHLMQQVAANKFGAITHPDAKQQQKIARFLEYRGFPISMIRNYLWDD